MNLYGPAENFNNVAIGDETTVTVYGKTFTGPYKGNSAASGGVLMYGVAIGSSLFTNGKGYVYDCTVTVNDALRVNTGGSYEIINTEFALASAGNGLVLNQASTNVTTVSGSTFRTGSNIAVNAGDILEFQNTNYINANITLNSGTVRLADNARLVFGNTSDISVGDLSFGNSNAITLGGTGKVAFASGEDFTGVSITVDTTNLLPANQIYTLATNVSGVTAADITVTDPDWWRVTLTGTTLKAETKATVAAMYGPAAKFGGAAVGDKVAFTAYGKKFAGTYYGDSAANGGVMMYGVTIGSTPYTNGQGYVYDCTVTGGLQVNSGGAYEVVNTVFQRSSAGFAIYLNEASTNVTTVTDCSFTANSQIYIKNNDILEFRGTNYINSAITVESGAGTVRLADNANIVFGNSSGTSIKADFTFGSNNSITFRGTGVIALQAGEDLSGVAITVDTTNFSISAPTSYEVVRNFAGVAVEDITVTGAHSGLWTLSLDSGKLYATSNFTKLTNMYGPAANFGGAAVGDTVDVTVYGTNFVGTYQGETPAGYGNSFMLYGVNTASGISTNSKNYVYDSTISGQLKVNGSGAYEIVNTTFNRASAGNVIWMAESSSVVTTVSNSTFNDGSNISVGAGDVLEFRDTNYLNASIAIESGNGTVRLADNAELVFGNASTIAICDLSFGSGNAVTFTGTGFVGFDAGEDFTGVAVTVDTSNYSISSPTTYTVATNFAGVAVEDITVTGTNSSLWTLSLDNGTLTATSNFTKLGNMYGPAAYFGGAAVGDTAVVTVDGTTFVGTYKGETPAGYDNGFLLYGVNTGTGISSNSKNYVYNSTITNQLKVNGSAAYEIVNTTFARTTSDNVIWMAQASSVATTVSNSTFNANSKIYIDGGNTLEFRDTNQICANVTVANGTCRLADNAELVFGNTADIAVGDLNFGTGNAITFGGTGKVVFASGESLAGVAVTVDTANFVPANMIYTLAENFSGVAVEDIVVTDPDWWRVTLTGTTLKAEITGTPAAMYGPAENFGGAAVGDPVAITVHGKKFAGTYQGNSAANGGVMMYGVTISSTPYTNGQGYVYDCTVTGGLQVNSGGAYEVVNTTFARSSAGFAIYLNEASNKVTTVTDCSFTANSQIYIKNNDILEFRGTNYINSAITVESGAGTVRLADNANIVFGNSSGTSIKADFTFGSNNSITFAGTGVIELAAGEDLSGVAITVDTTNYSLSGSATYQVALNFAGVAVEDITVTGANSELWTLSLENGTLTASSNFTAVGNMYGPAANFGGASVGDTVVVTAEGKTFRGTYQGETPAGYGNGFLLYGVNTGTGISTNSKNYVYDSTISGQLKVNGSGAYEIVNTTFARTSADNVIWMAEASSIVTTVSGSTFLAGNNILVNSGDVLEFRDTNYFDANITIYGGNGTVRLANDAELVFGNTAAISIDALTLGTGNAFTFNGSAQVNFTSQDLSAAAITVSADLLGESTVIATGVTLAANQSITVGDNTYTLGETFTYGGADYAFSCTGNTFSVADVTKYDEVFVAPDGTESIVIDGETIPLAGKPVYTSLDSALDHMAANGSVTVYNTTDSVSSTFAYFMSTQTVNGDLNIVADGLDFTRYYIIGNNSTFGNVSGDIYFEFRNAETQRIMLSGENQAHDLCRNGVITVKDATVTGYVAGGGSGANCRIAGDITINVVDSEVAAVYATRGNPVGGEAVINLSGATVGTVARTDGAAVAVPVTLNVIDDSVITGNASGLDVITIESGATLLLGAGAAIDNTVVKAGGALEITSGADTGAKLTLDFTGAASGAATDINDLGLVGASTTVFVEGLEQAYGTFTLGYGATGNEAFALGFGDGNDYVMDGTLTSVVDAFTGKTYSTSVDAGALKLTAAAGTHTIAAVNTADSLATSGATFNGGDREAKWTENTAAATNVYLASGMTDGNAWLEIDGYNGSTATTLYGTAANQVFDGAVNLDLKSGSLRNLAAGAGTGGSVKAVNLSFDGATLNGVGYAGGFGSVTGTTDTQIADGTFTKDFYAGALANKLTTATSVGDVAMTIAGGTFSGNIYGASAVKTDTTKGNGTRHTAGDVTLTITDGETTKGTQACIFAGGYATGDATGTVYTVDSVTLDISGGDWGTAAGGRGVFGGIMASGVEAQVIGDVNITISGDATMGNVYGGGWAQKTNGRSVVGDVNINIAGGTIANVFGGGSHSTSGGATEAGDVTITVSGGNITGAIYARGQLAGDATEAAEVIFTGATDFGCDVFGYSHVGGAASDANLSYTGYTGEFSGALGGFNGITFDGATAMELTTAAADVSNGAWEFDLTDRASALAGTSLLTWSTADFANDTIKVSFADETQAKGGWNIATVAEEFAGTTFAVEVGGSQIANGLAYGDQIATGDYAGWGFELESGVLKFKNIA